MGEKLYYTIGEVAKMLDVNPSLLRFWEREIPELKPRKSEGGSRYYTSEDIAMLKQVYHLTRDCGYTLDGAREQLRLHGEDGDRQQLVQTLLDLKQFLLDLKAQL